MMYLKQITKKYFQNTGESKLVLNQLTVAFQPHEFVGILGPSGCGKSTLLRLIAGLESADSGEISISQDIQRGFVFQEANLLPWLTVEENAILSFRLQNKKPPTSLLEEWIQKLNLAAARRKFPHELSGGMKMRASLLRAMVMRPQLLLLDEPFAALDEVIRVDLQRQLFHFCREEKLTVLFVTHSISEATKMCDRLLLFDYGGSVILDRQQVLTEYQFQMSEAQRMLSGEILQFFPKSQEKNFDSKEGA